MTTAKIFKPGTQQSLIETARKTPPIKIGKHLIKIEPEDFNEFYAEKARIELNETPETVKRGLEELRTLLREEPDLVILDEDEFLYKFLRPIKWDAKSAFDLMKRFYQFHLNNPRFCKGLVPKNERAVLISGILTFLPERSDGCRILIIQSGKKWKPKQVSLDQIFRGVMLCLEAAMSEPITQVSGVHVILDMDGLSLSHVTHFTPSFASAVLEWVQRCLPCRLKGVHIVNQPYIFNMVFAIFKPFIHEKLRKRIYFHGTNRDSLLEQLEAKAIPTEYGGEFNLPKEPLGEALYEYFHAYEEEFIASCARGYSSKS